MLRSRIPFPPTKVFKDRKKEALKKACRGRQTKSSSFFALAFAEFKKVLAPESVFFCNICRTPTIEQTEKKEHNARQNVESSNGVKRD